LATPQRASRHGTPDHTSAVRRASDGDTYRLGLVMAPSLAECTSAAYLASTPLV